MGVSCIKIYLLDNDNNPVPKIPVYLVSINQKVRYAGQTNNKGYAFFFVPSGENYIVDAGTVRNFGKTDKIVSGSFVNQSYLFVKYDFVENVKNDTIMQIIKDDAVASSTHVLEVLKVINTQGEIISDENIYLQQLSSGKIYAGKTDNQRKVTFLLPKGEKYMINFDFRKNVDVINFLTVHGIAEGNRTIVYNPDPKLQYPEQFIPTPEQIVLNDFSNYNIYSLNTEKKIDLHAQWGNDTVSSSTKQAILQFGIYINQKNMDLTIVLCNKFCLYCRFYILKADKNIENQLVEIELSYFDLAENKIIKIKQTKVLHFSNDIKNLKLINEQNQKKLYAIAIMNQAIKLMADAFSKKNVKSAQTAINNALVKVNEIYPKCDDKEVKELLDQLLIYQIALDNFFKKQNQNH